MTLTKRIIPCLDVKNGRVVKGLHFESIKDAGDPVELAEKYKNKEVVWLAVNSTHYMGNEDNKKWAEQHGVPYPILNDSSGEVGKIYGAKTTPHMYIIDKSNGLVYEGGIDDDKSGANTSDQRINYVDIALTNLSSGDTIEISKSKPYGCAVKYK